VHPTPRQLRGVLAIAALPWCAFISLLVINPKYELHLVDPATPGLFILSAALIAQLFAAGLAYAFIGFFNALAQRSSWSRRPRIVAYALVVVAFSVLCSLPLLLLAVLGPAAAFLIQAEMP